MICTERPYIIAEMACAHEGDLGRAKALVDVAGEAGADAVQFELVDPDDNIVPHTDVYRLLQRLYFSPAQWRELFEYTRRYDIAIFSYAYDYVSLLTSFQLGTDALKLNSSDLSNPDMVIKSAESRLPVTIGTGASTMDEIAESVELYLENGGYELVLMHGVQNFPTDIKYAHIRRIQLLQAAFDCLVGYADHTDGSSPLSRIIDLVAVGMGAVIIEKHITLNRSEKGIDHEAALEPLEFKDFIRVIRNASVALGQSRIMPLNESDVRYRQFQKKTVVASCDISQGTEIKRDNIAFLRNDLPDGLSPMKTSQILGKKVLRNIDKFEPILLTDVAD